MSLIVRSDERGVSLIETLIAVSILSVVGVTFVSVLGTNYNVLRIADQRTAAENLANAQIEAINNEQYDSTPPYAYTKISGIPAGYDINIVVSIINPETGAVSGTDLGVQKIVVTVTSQQRSPPEVLTVESYKK